MSYPHVPQPGAYYPHPGYNYPQYRTPPVSPAPAGNYSTRATPSPRASASPRVSGHSRRASHAFPSQYGHGYGPSPRGPAPPPQDFSGYPSSRGPYASPRPSPDFVSDSDDFQHPNSRRRHTDWVPPKHSSDRRHRRYSQSRYARPVVVDGVEYSVEEYLQYLHDLKYYSTPPPPYQRYDPYGRYEKYRDADQSYGQVPIYTRAEPEPEPRQTRHRRASHSARPQSTPQKRPTPKIVRRATEEDARRAGIPAGYSYKNWDPTEEPIMLLGSVFDANSLGKWIYDWTVFHYGPDIPIAEVAGELWLLLIQLAGKVKRAEEVMPKIRKSSNRELVEEFLESGARLWIRFAKTLKTCEEYMYRAQKKKCGDQRPTYMGKESGCEFVDSIFGRDRELEKTEKLMTGMRLWSMRFDANCNEILRNPSA